MIGGCVMFGDLVTGLPHCMRWMCEGSHFW